MTDLTTGRTEQRRFQLRVTKNPINVYVSPTPSQSQKMPSTFFVSTFYADGTPAHCKVQLSVSNDDETNPRNSICAAYRRTNTASEKSRNFQFQNWAIVIR